MTFRRRRKLSANQRIDMWSRWKAGQSLHAIGRAFGKDHVSIQFMLSQHGGIVPATRRRSLLTLTLAEREDISRGIASGSSIREIAKGLQRTVSTVSREVARHGGRPLYRASEADHQAWESALRPKMCLLAIHVKPQKIVAGKLILDWSPEQISGWLKIQYPEDESMRVSHETIYRSLFIQARGVLKKELIQHLRSKRRIRRSRHSRVRGHRSGQIVDAISIRERPAEIEDRAIPGHWEGDLLSWHQEQSHRNSGGTPFAFYRAGQGAQQRHRSCRGRAEPARSEATRIAAALADLGPRVGDGQTQELHGGHECESLLL
jgi:Helix-turn-helix domain